VAGARAEVTERRAVVSGGKPYGLARLSPTRISAYRMVGESVLTVGETTLHGLFSPTCRKRRGMTPRSFAR
jgi:hypothetical protein